MFSLYLMWMFQAQNPVDHKVYPIAGQQEWHVYSADNKIFRSEIIFTK